MRVGYSGIRTATVKGRRDILISDETLGVGIFSGSLGVAASIRYFPLARFPNFRGIGD
jgi:hypothetical protein